MNKQKQLIQQLIRQAVIGVVAVLVAAGIFVGASMYGDTVESRKTEMEQKANQDQATVASLNSQMEKSNVAEKSYGDILTWRDNQDFSARPEALSSWLRNAQKRFRVGYGKTVDTVEEESKKSELANFTYKFTIKSHLRVEMQAISDTHIFSYIDSLRREAPGLIRIDALTLKRTKEMSSSEIDGMRTGGATPLVEAALEFSYIGLRPKEQKPADGGAPAPAGN